MQPFLGHTLICMQGRIGMAQGSRCPPPQFLHSAGSFWIAFWPPCPTVGEANALYLFIGREFAPETWKSELSAKNYGR